VALTAFCPTCQRTVYIEEGQTPVCPVCSSPLLETVEARDEDEIDAEAAETAAAEQARQTGGA
jgi:hypothetical protein